MDIKKWVDRFELELVLQKQLGIELVRMTFTRRELIELKTLLGSLLEAEQKLASMQKGE